MIFGLEERCAAAEDHGVDHDPKFVDLEKGDLRLTKNSPAVDAGVPVPKEWPDPLRQSDEGKPDVGALPLGAEMLKVGPWR